MQTINIVVTSLEKTINSLPIKQKLIKPDLFIDEIDNLLPVLGININTDLTEPDSTSSDRQRLCFRLYKVRYFLQQLRDEDVKVSVVMAILHSLLQLAKAIANQQSLKSSNKNDDILQILLEHIPYHIFWKDCEGRYLGANKQFAQMAGFEDAQGLIGRHDIELGWKPREAENFISYDQIIMGTGEAALNVEKPIRQADGSNRYILSSKVPLKNKNQQPDGIFGIFSDITERRETQLALEKSLTKIHDGIKYASLLQRAILPNKALLTEHFEDNFIIWKPKDIVGGDIYFVDEISGDDGILISLMDCIGHSVIGGFVAMLAKSIYTQILTEITNQKLPPSPGFILQELNTRIQLLSNENNDFTDIGLDACIIYYSKKTQQCIYAGAKIPLYVLRGSSIEVYNSGRKSVGYLRNDRNQPYEDVSVNIAKGDMLAFTTDGMVDQLNDSGLSFYKSRISSVLTEHIDQPYEKIKTALLKSFNAFKLVEEQTDDIAIIGLKI